MTTTELGTRSGTAVVVIGVAYAVVLAAGMLRHGLTEPIVDPILAVMELLTIASAFPIAGLFVALHGAAGPDRRRVASLALAAAACFAVATTGVHVTELTVGRATGRSGLVWPSTTYAVELLAWDVLLGLALLLGAQALPERPASGRVRAWLRVTGALCLAGTAGPLAGNMRLQLAGVFGYAVVLPFAAWAWRGWFRADDAATAPSGRTP